jgi:hypothetical protein
VASRLAPRVEVGVDAAAPAALLLKSDQLLGLLGFASGTSAQWSSGGWQLLLLLGCPPRVAGTRGKQLIALTRRACEEEMERDTGVRATGANKLGPLGRGRESARARNAGGRWQVWSTYQVTHTRGLAVPSSAGLG